MAAREMTAPREDDPGAIDQNAHSHRKTTDTPDGISGGRGAEGGETRWEDLPLDPQHVDKLKSSGISPLTAKLRGYETVHDPRRLDALGFAKEACHPDHAPGLLIPQLDARGSVWGYQYRPDNPRTNATGKPIKYESQTRGEGRRRGLDVPPLCGGQIDDPEEEKWIVEGTLKADCLAEHGICAISVSGVWNWRGTNQRGGKVALPDWNDVAIEKSEFVIAYDSDVVHKKPVHAAMVELSNYLYYRAGNRVRYCHLPDGPDGQKWGADDYLAAGHTREELYRLVKPDHPALRNWPHGDQDTLAADGQEPEPDPVGPMSLDEAHAVFKRWLGNDYDTDALDAMLATAAVEKLGDGSDPVWLLIISGPGAAKTETVQSLDGIGATVTSTLSSDAALLSATSRRERAEDATGGLLRKIGDRGVLVIKDVTSIMSMNRDIRGKVLSALREIYDGRWYREVGTDGGHTLEWRGRIAVVGAVTTAWDAAHAVISTMGDRFVLVRIDSTTKRQAAGRKAIGNTGEEACMRKEVAEAVAGVLAGMNREPTKVTSDETEILLGAADLVTLARTGVEYAYNGDVIDAHAPEMPTRFAKQLTQVVRGGVAVGMSREAAMRLAIRCARDSMPPLRLEIIDDLAAHPQSTASDVRRRINKPRTTVDRQLQALHMLGVADVKEEEYGNSGKIRWCYSLNDDISPEAIRPECLPDLSLNTPNPNRRESETEKEAACLNTDKSGAHPPPPQSFSPPSGGVDPSDCETCTRHTDYNPAHSCYYCGKPVRGEHFHHSHHPLHPKCRERGWWLT